MKLLLALSAWRLVRRLAAPAIIIAATILLIHDASFARPHKQHAGGAIERVVRPLKHDLQHALGKAFRP